MFSATGSLLTGSQLRPDIYTISINEKAPFGRSTKRLAYHSILNKLGYIPLVSTVTGLGRAHLGMIHSIVHLAIAIFNPKNRVHHFEEAKLGGINLGRGLVEVVPVFGNITTSVVDMVRAKKFGKQAEAIIAKNPKEYKDRVTLFAHGKEIVKHSVDDVDKELDKRSKNKKLSPNAIINMLNNMS